MKQLTIFLAALCFSALAQAHSGHGRDGGDSTLLHYLSEPEHVAALVLLVAVIGGAIGLRRRRRRRDR
jgi:hypothetical protein